MDSEWIEHHGKGYPDLPMDTLVQVRFRDGEEDGKPYWTVHQWNINWGPFEDVQCAADITHYRVVTR